MLRQWATRAFGRLLYRRRLISLEAADRYEQLSRAMGRGGWEVLRIDGPSCLLRRRRLRLP